MHISLFTDKPTISFTYVPGNTTDVVTCIAESKPLSNITVFYSDSDGQNVTSSCLLTSDCHIHVLSPKTEVSCQAVYQSEKISSIFSQRSMQPVFKK